jgi:hypothetical protein
LKTETGCKDRHEERGGRPKTFSKSSDHGSSFCRTPDLQNRELSTEPHEDFREESRDAEEVIELYGAICDCQMGVDTFALYPVHIFALLRQVLYAMSQTVKAEETRAGLDWLKTELPDYWASREKIVRLLDYLAGLRFVGSMPQWGRMPRLRFLSRRCDNEHNGRGN